MFGWCEVKVVRVNQPFASYKHDLFCPKQVGIFKNKDFFLGMI
jgi:hypothetical protein